MLLTLGTAAFAVLTPSGRSDDEFFTPKRITIRDDCDPNSVWVPPGCALRQGDVTPAEFEAERLSPLAAPPAEQFLVGHQAWRFDPPYLKITEGQSVRVRNRGGRGHTFTEVEEFGGGFVPPLRVGLAQAKECNPATADILVPGESIRLAGLAADDVPFGSHRFQCCIHSWMRAIIKVKPEVES